MTENKIVERAWSDAQRHLRYDEEEMRAFRANPANARILAAVPRLRDTTILFTVVSAEHCNARHVEGMTVRFTGDGQLLTRKAPRRLCVYLVSTMSTAIYGIQELIYAGVDPVDLCFKRFGCPDVGVRCEGWGHCVVEARVEGRDGE